MDVVETKTEQKETICYLWLPEIHWACDKHTFFSRCCLLPDWYRVTAQQWTYTSGTTVQLEISVWLQMMTVAISRQKVVTGGVQINYTNIIININIIEFSS